MAARATLGVYGIILALGVAHLGGITLSAVQRDPFVYDFRFYTLLLVGFLMIVPSLVALRQVRGLARGRAESRRCIRLITLVILAVNIPLIPTELGFFPFTSLESAGGLVAFGTLVSGLAALEWAVLLISSPIPDR